MFADGAEGIGLGGGLGISGDGDAHTDDAGVACAHVDQGEAIVGAHAI